MARSSSQNLSFIYGLLDNGQSKIRAYLDSGSELSIVDLKMIKNRSRIVTTTNVELTSASGHSLKVIGRYTLKVQFGDVMISEPCIVVENFLSIDIVYRCF
jgi:hypothetical protein